MSSLDGSLPSLEKRILSHSSIDELAQMLIKCRKEKDRVEALHVHSHICACGLDAHQSLSNYLVPLFVDVGAMSDAQQVFDKMLYKHGISWNSLIYGYTKSSTPHCAFDLYARMRVEDSMHPSGHTIVALFKACTKLADLERGLEIHAAISKLGLLEKDPFVGTSLVDMYAKCGAITKAREIFEQLPDRDVISWTTLIAGYVEAGDGEEALQCFEHMGMEGFSPDCIAIVCVLKACSHMQAVEKGKQIHVQATTIGAVGEDAFVCSTLIDMYGKFGLICKAQQIFDEVLIHDTISWTTLIMGYSEHEQGEMALKCFEQMHVEGIHPDGIAFVCSLKACGSVGALVKLLEIHSKIARMGLLEKDLVLANTLLGIYVKFRLLDEACEVFDKLFMRDEVSWTVLISGHAEEGNAKESIDCFERMQLEGIRPNSVTYIAILKTFSTAENLEKIQAIHAEIERRGLFGAELVGTTLVDTYVKCGTFDAAEYVFGKLPIRDVVSWTALITGYAELGHGAFALERFSEMRMEGISPSDAAFTCILKACGSIGSIAKGQEVHEEVESLGLLERDIVMGTTLVDMYLKCGHLAKARECFDKLRARDVITWNTLISGYVEHDQSKEALKCYEKMHSENIAPDLVTLVCVLKACGRTGAVDEGRGVHVKVEKKGSFKSEIALALVSMYVKCGSIPEAWETFLKLRVHEVGPWNSVIKAFAEQGRGTEVVECLIRMEVDGISPDSGTLLCILKGCGSIESEMMVDLSGGSSDDTASDGGCQLLAVAESVFEDLPVRDVGSWSALISAYNKRGDEDKAMRCFERMQIEGAQPNHAALICSSLKACGSVEAMEKLYEIHGDTEKRGMLEGDASVGNSLVHVYSQRGELAAAHQVFERLLVRDVVSWTALIAGCSENGHGGIAVACLERMRIEGVSPDAIACSCGLKACGRVGAMERAEDLLAEAEQSSDYAVCCSRIAAYARCGMHGKAARVFESLPVRDAIAWSALQAGYWERGLDEAALDCLEQMRVEGVSPDAVSYVCSLKACGRMGALDEGREVHSRMEAEGGVVAEGEEKRSSTGEALIGMYGRCDAMAEAQSVFDRMMPVRDAVAWNALVEGYAENGFGEEALACIEHMRIEGCCDPPGAATLACGLRACASLRAESSGRGIHALVEKHGLGDDIAVRRALVEMYARCGRVDVARALSDGRGSCSAAWCWAALLAGYVERGEGEEAMRCLESSMRCLESSTRCLESSTRCLESSTRCLESPMRCLESPTLLLHGGEEEEEEEEQEEHLRLRSALVDMYAKCGLLRRAREAFDELRVRDVVAWTTLMEAYSAHERGLEALRCVERMRIDGVAPDRVALACGLKACRSLGAAGKLREMHCEAEKKGFLLLLLQPRRCFGGGSPQSAAAAAAAAAAAGGIVGNALVDAYAKLGLHLEAHQVFDRLPSRDAVAWNSLLGAYARRGEPGVALSVLHTMLAASPAEAAGGGAAARPDPITLLVVCSACIRGGLCSAAASQTLLLRFLLRAMGSSEEEHGAFSSFFRGPELRNAVVSLLCHAGLVDLALMLLLDTMVPSSQGPGLAVAWHTVLGACRDCGNEGIAKLAFAKCSAPL